MWATVDEPWVTGPAPSPDARLLLLCFPSAGGSAAEFRGWATGLPAGVQISAVQLPGRANRAAEPPFVALPPLIDALHGVLRHHLRCPFALFGHSMGALIAYELARRLQADGQAPARLYVSGHRAPHLPCRQPPTHHLPENRFINELRRLEGTPEAVLRDPEMRELVLPLLRADFSVAETYVHLPGPLLGCPVLALGGRDDPLVTEAEIAAWRDTTTGAFGYRMIRGAHFFPEQAREHVLNVLAGDLRRALAEPAPE